MHRRRIVDQKSAALTLRHVDRIGELMEDDDDADDDAMTSDGRRRRSLDKHAADRHVVGGLPQPGVAESPSADADASCEQLEERIGCHGDGDERDQQQHLTDSHEECLPTQLPQQQQQQQQPLTGECLSASLLSSLSPSLRLCTFVHLRV